jgi:uncharacterized protein
MSDAEVTVVHIYALEGRGQVNSILEILRKEDIMGATVIRAISGYGKTGAGKVHTSSLLALSLQLPLIVEFFGEPGRVQEAIYTLRHKLNLRHIISWKATSHTLE